MSNPMFKNIAMAEVVEFAALVDYQEGQVVSRTLVQNSSVSITLFTFAGGEGLSKHTAAGDALVYILDGEALITIDERTMKVSAGQAVVMPANVPHAVAAEVNFKMALILVKPEKS